jgi:hypothetical protein
MAAYLLKEILVVGQQDIILLVLVEPIKVDLVLWEVLML